MVAATRKRASSSCEAGQLAIGESFGGAAVLSSTIADMIHKKGLCHSPSGDPLLNRVIKCARLAPENYAAPSREDIGGRYLDVSSARYEAKNAAVIEKVAVKFGYSVMSDGATVKHTPLINVLGGEWQKKIGNDPTTPCYMVMAKPINNNCNDEGAAEDAPDDGEEFESYRINDALFAMIKDPRSGHPDTFRIEEKEEGEKE